MQSRAGCRLRWWRLVVWLLLLVALTSASVLPEKQVDLLLLPVVAPRRFDWLNWEVAALISEAGRWLGGGAREHRTALLSGSEDVVAYVARQREMVSLERQIDREYARGVSRLAAPLVDEQHSVKVNVAELERSLARLQEEQARATPLVEQILSAQVAQVLSEEGFGAEWYVWPPISFRFTDMPTYLVISPRDEIYVYRGIFLDPGLGPAERIAVEQAVEDSLGMSALVDDVGGIGSWPTMVIDPVSLRSLLDIVAHEWSHTYLFFRPLGQHYDDSRDLTTMNETVASLVGEEVAQRVLDTYYPQIVATGSPSGPVWVYPTKAPDVGTPETFSQAMRRIRLRVDDLLANDQVEEAERYMELERQKLVEKGSDLRRLNQAYFAFHGSYATSPSSVDPIGPWMRELRAQEGSLKAFLETVSIMTTIDDLHKSLAS
jgi:hypothetical protein